VHHVACQIPRQPVRSSCSSEPFMPFAMHIDLGCGN
jgi:hypothetical protein